jgi:hypothetical protein
MMLSVRTAPVTPKGRATGEAGKERRFSFLKKETKKLGAGLGKGEVKLRRGSK